jgi:hypothetical protein
VTSFSEDWNSTFESEPADNENINLGAMRIRSLKVDIRERMRVDHLWADNGPNGEADDGKHQQSTYVPSSTDPVLDATNGCVYAKVVSGVTQLFYEDSTGAVTQLTPPVTPAAFFPSGTTMFFVQPAPPPGWTQVLVNDVVVRVTSGAGGGVGGGWIITGVSVASSTTTSVLCDSITDVTVDPHTLTTAEIPSHQHNFLGRDPGDETGGVMLEPILVDANPALADEVPTDGGDVGGGAHSHMASATTSTTASASSATVSTFSNDGTWRPEYVDAIMAAKN